MIMTIKMFFKKLFTLKPPLGIKSFVMRNYIKNKKLQNEINNKL